MLIPVECDRDRVTMPSPYSTPGIHIDGEYVVQSHNKQHRDKSDRDIIGGRGIVPVNFCKMRSRRYRRARHCPC